MSKEKNEHVACQPAWAFSDATGLIRYELHRVYGALNGELDEGLSHWTEYMQSDRSISYAQTRGMSFGRFTSLEEMRADPSSRFTH